MKKLIHKLGIHFWMHSHTQGINKYYVCTVCGKREVRFPEYGGYSPIDKNWLEAKTTIR